MTSEEAIKIINCYDIYFYDLSGAKIPADKLAEAMDMAIEALSADAVQGWIPVSERLPKMNEYVDDVCKYYLIQDEYGDMHVAHLGGRGWEPMESITALECDVVAWMPLPEPYREDGEA